MDLVDVFAGKKKGEKRSADATMLDRGPLQGLAFHKKDIGYNV